MGREGCGLPTHYQGSTALICFAEVIRAKEEEAELTYGEVLLGQDARRDLQESRSERRALEESMSSAEATLAQQRLELQQKAGRFATLTEHVDRLEKEVAGYAASFTHMGVVGRWGSGRPTFGCSALGRIDAKFCS